MGGAGGGGPEKYFYELYVVLAIVYVLVATATVQILRARRVEHPGARGAILAAAIGGAIAWIYGTFFRLPLVLRAEARTQWTRLLPVALAAVIAFFVVWLAYRTKVRPFRPLFAALALGPAWFVGSVLWSTANMIADDRLHGVGASFGPQREHALWVGAGFGAVALVVGGFLARVASAPDPADAKTPTVNDDARGPSRGARAERRRRRRS